MGHPGGVRSGWVAVHGVWVVSRVSKQVDSERGHATVLEPPDPLNLPVVEPNPRGHQPGERCREPRCGNCHWDVQRFKYWLRGRLLAGGADDAEVDRPLGAQTPGLVWRIGSRLCAIEVRSAPVDIAHAAERTARLRAVGVDEVLWLCPPGFWVPHLSALAIDDFAAAGCEYRVVDGQRGQVRHPESGRAQPQHLVDADGPQPRGPLGGVRDMDLRAAYLDRAQARPDAPHQPRGLSAERPVPPHRRRRPPAACRAASI